MEYDCRQPRRLSGDCSPGQGVPSVLTYSQLDASEVGPTSRGKSSDEVHRVQRRSRSPISHRRRGRGRARVLIETRGSSTVAPNRTRAFSSRSLIRAMLMPLIVAVVLLAFVLVPVTQASPGSSLGAPRTIRNSALTSGTSTWAVQHDGFAVAGISCPSTMVCLAAGNVSEGGAFASMSGSTWTNPSVVSGTDSLSQISCPITSTCFAVGMSSATPSEPIVEEITNSDGTWTWTQFTDPSEYDSGGTAAVDTISCDSGTQCVIGGETVTSEYSTAALVAQLTISEGTPTWVVSTDWDGDRFVSGVSCTSSGNCAAIEDASNMWFSTNGGTTWTESTGTMPNAGSYYFGISCQPTGSSTTCVAVGTCSSGVESPCEGGADPQNVAITSFTSPSDPDLSWTWEGGQQGELSSVACSTPSQCMAVGFEDESNTIANRGCTFGVNHRGNSLRRNSSPVR